MSGDSRIFFRSIASKIAELCCKITVLGENHSIFQKTSLWKYAGFNKTLIVRDFKFTIGFLDKTEGEKRKGNNLP